MVIIFLVHKLHLLIVYQYLFGIAKLFLSSIMQIQILFMRMTPEYGIIYQKIQMELGMKFNFKKWE